LRISSVIEIGAISEGGGAPAWSSGLSVTIDDLLLF
jgi:hypothetical protein